MELGGLVAVQCGGQRAAALAHELVAPTWEFSWKSLGSLFSFGGLMLLSSLVETIYTNLQRLIIGKMFTPSDLGYYNQAKKLEEVPTTTLSTIVNEVSFPVFSKLQDDRQQLHRALRKNI